MLVFGGVQKPNGGSGGQKFRPPKSSSKSSSSVQDEIEIEIAEVLYGMMRQPQSQVPSKQQEMNDSIKLDSREGNNNNNNKSSGSDGKSRISSPPQNSSSSATPVSAVGLFFIYIFCLFIYPNYHYLTQIILIIDLFLFL